MVETIVEIPSAKAYIAADKLPNVCNGYHIYSSKYSDGNAVLGVGLEALDQATEEDLVKAMAYETKAIMVVAHTQKKIRKLLQDLYKDYKSGSPVHELRAKMLCKWSSDANLWIIRKN